MKKPHLRFIDFSRIFSSFYFFFFFIFLVWLLIFKVDNDKINTVPAVSQRVILLFFFLSICFFIFYEINERETRLDATSRRKERSYPIVSFALLRNLAWLSLSRSFARVVFFFFLFFFNVFLLFFYDFETRLERCSLTKWHTRIVPII